MPLFHRYFSGLHVEWFADGDPVPDFGAASMGLIGWAAHGKSSRWYQDKRHSQSVGDGFFKAVIRTRKKDEDHGGDKNKTCRRNLLCYHRFVVH
jgi:hypothetical protein